MYLVDFLVVSVKRLETVDSNVELCAQEVPGWVVPISDDSSSSTVVADTVGDEIASDFVVSVVPSEISVEVNLDVDFSVLNILTVDGLVDSATAVEVSVCSGVTERVAAVAEYDVDGMVEVDVYVASVVVVVLVSTDVSETFIVSTVVPVESFAVDPAVGAVLDNK